MSDLSDAYKMICDYDGSAAIYMAKQMKYFAGNDEKTCLGDFKLWRKTQADTCGNVDPELFKAGLRRSREITV